MTAALESYLYSIQQIAEIIEAISPESATSFREPLLSLRSRLAADPTPAALEQSRDALHELLQSFCQRARLQNETLARDLNQTLSMVTRTEDSSAGRNVQHVEQLLDFVDRLESAVRSGDLPRLSAWTSELRDFVQSIELDSRDDFARLRQKMIQIQRRLHEVELLATLDPLTGVANRRDLDRELAARIEARPEFCVLLFDLNGFKEINDRFGHLYGDQALKQLAARLSSQVRARDYVCRWGGDEFLAILACDLAVAESRSRQIAGRLNGPYQIFGPAGERRVDITVTVGLVQYCAGESPEQLFRRVDEAMYRQKHLASGDSSGAG
ncbi:MAG: diguanylate cyclase domain-containing protein [Bryobacteraceae bacterium]